MASSTKQRALDDAQHAQAAVLELCRRTNQPLPPYHLTELIGKGSFGRVYKATTTTTTTTPSQLVAVKIINIEHGDSLAPGLADTLADLQAETRALQALRSSDAPRSINRVVEALLVGSAVWLVLEHCAGGSVATLMRPSRPRGLREKWIVPILRETAAALAWVHAQGVLHRDVKAANVLVAEDGGAVQLCDFGVAATLRSRAEKRSTLVGTAHWMAPELLGSGGGGAVAYGSEVDVWAFGALAYELAMGHPPNAALGMGLARLGRQLQMQSPRLTGDEFSAGVQDLVGAFQTWEARGGHRGSLFAAGGAAATHADAAADEQDGTQGDWNFGTGLQGSDADVLDDSDREALSGAYGIGMDSPEMQQQQQQQPSSSTSRRQQRRQRRRPPARHTAVKSPLEKVFDSNTLSSYDDYSRQYYARFLPEPVQLALLQSGVAGPRAEEHHRESLIDLDLCVVGSSSSSSSSSASGSVDMSTVRPATVMKEWEAQAPPSLGFGSTKRATRDWTFPSMFSQQPTREEGCHFPSQFDEVYESSASDSSHGRSESGDGLIDLDMSTALHSTAQRHQREGRQRAQKPSPPPLPSAPLPQVMMGQAADEQVKDELHRMTASLADHLRYATAYLADLPIRRMHAATSG